jgi:hypothetical protein
MMGMPRIAVIHIQKIAPGPPEASAVATPTRLPAPTSLPIAEQSAPNALTPEESRLAFHRFGTSWVK